MDRIIKWLSGIYAKVTLNNVLVSGTGVQKDTGFNVFFQFEYSVKNRYFTLKTFSEEAKSRHNLAKCTILNVKACNNANSANIDKFQYLQLS